MKKIFVIFSLMCCVAASAYEVPQNTQVITYALPKTMAEVQVEYDHVVVSPGIFWQYAERYLGKVDVVTEKKEYCQLKDVKLRTYAVADSNKTFALAAAKGLPQLIINGKGVLVAVGDVAVPDAKRKPQAEECLESFDKKNMLPPLTEEQLRAGSMAKMAESTAKMIYRIREDRMNLLNGETDAPDGEALKTMLRKLEQTERQLTEMFVGTSEVKHKTTTLPLDLADEGANRVLFRFSSVSGVLEADDLAGAPVMFEIKTDKVAYEFSKKTPKAPKNAIYYNQPGRVNIKIYDDKNVYIARDVDVAQLGVIVPLPGFVLKPGHGALLNTATGAVKTLK